MRGMEGLASLYAQKKPEIRDRLNDFERVWKKGSEEEVFSELCFCLLTPQSGAFACDAAIKRCLEDGTIFFGGRRALEKKIYPIRFYRNKSKYVLEAREKFSNSEKLEIKKILSGIVSNSLEAREWLVKNVKGLGYKEASHFLRNIGFGRSIAILDRHILKNMKKHGVIKNLPKTISKKNYLMLEKKLLAFSEKAGIPAAELDLLFWSAETGIIFK